MKKSLVVVFFGVLLWFAESNATGVAELDLRERLPGERIRDRLLHMLR